MVLAGPFDSCCGDAMTDRRQAVDAASSMASSDCGRWARRRTCPTRRNAQGLPLVRAAERWRAIEVSDFERRQMTAFRAELDHEYETQTGLAKQHREDAIQAKLSSSSQTCPVETRAAAPTSLFCDQR